MTPFSCFILLGLLLDNRSLSTLSKRWVLILYTSLWINHINNMNNLYHRITLRTECRCILGKQTNKYKVDGSDLRWYFTNFQSTKTVSFDLIYKSSCISKFILKSHCSMPMIFFIFYPLLLVPVFCGDGEQQILFWSI